MGRLRIVVPVNLPLAAVGGVLALWLRGLHLSAHEGAVLRSHRAPVRKCSAHSRRS